MSTVELVEYERRVIPGLQPTAADRAAAENPELAKRLMLRWLHDGSLEVKADAYVGVLALECVTLQVRPKLVGGELGVLQMLDYASDLSARVPLASAHHLDTGLDLRDLVCLLLVQEADRVLRSGPRRDYVRRQEPLPAVRGRLLADRQMLVRHGRLDRLECRFDELSSDIPDNRLCAAGLVLAARTARDPLIRTRARRLAADFAELSDPSVDFRSFRPDYHRANEHYRDAHRWALMLLGGSAFDGLFTSHGPAQQAFLLNMNLLFEWFVTQLLRDASYGTAVRVHAQTGNRRALLDHLGRTYRELIPDVVLKSGHGPSARHICLDAKYKLYDDAERKLSPADLYQALTYARAYSSGPSVPRAFILYPSATDDASHTITLHDHDGTPSARITTQAINVPTTLANLRTNPKTALSPLRNLFATDPARHRPDKPAPHTEPAPPPPQTPTS